MANGGDTVIRNLNKLTFSGYGKILQERQPNHGFPKGDEWLETQRTIKESERRKLRC